MISKCSYKLPKSKKHMERGEYVHCERRRYIRRMNFPKNNFFSTNLNPLMPGCDKRSNILNQTYSFSLLLCLSMCR